MKRYSTSYRFTFEKNDLEGQQKLETLRKNISNYNKFAETPQRVCVRGRLGKNNPNAAKYNVGGIYYNPFIMNVKMLDASRFDVYIYSR